MTFPGGGGSQRTTHTSPLNKKFDSENTRLARFCTAIKDINMRSYTTGSWELGPSWRTPWAPGTLWAYPLTPWVLLGPPPDPWGPESESRINSRTYLGQFGLVSWENGNIHKAHFNLFVFCTFIKRRYSCFSCSLHPFILFISHCCFTPAKPSPTTPSTISIAPGCTVSLKK